MNSPTDVISSLKENKWINNKGTPNNNIKKLVVRNLALLDTVSQHTNFLPSTSSIKERIYCIVNNIKQQQICTCGKLTKFKGWSYGYPRFCSPKCAQQDQQTRNNQKRTLIQRYGVDNPMKSPRIRQTYEETCLKRYGAKHHWFNKNIQEKKKKNYLDKYGVENGNQVHLSKEIINLLNSKEWLYNEHVVKEKSLTQISTEIGVDGTTVGNYCKKHNISILFFQQSFPEKQLSEFLKEYNIQVLTNVRNIISPYELDIYLPEYGLAIEYCGLYWHSDKIRDKNYHQKKYILCREKNIRLLTIFEDEWLEKKELVKTKILSILKKDPTPSIFARQCKVKQIDTKTKKQFLTNYHIQGNGRSSINYGLFFDEKLVSVMSLIEKRDHTFELNRFASSNPVVGGFSKLLSYFCKYHRYTNIYTFADLRWSEGNLYKMTGFEHVHVVPPTYEYFKTKKRFHRSLFMKKHLNKRLGGNFDPKKTEFINTDNSGYFRIWNCGLVKFEKRNLA